MNTSLVALPADFVEMRRGHVKQHGAMTLDVILAAGACTRCKQFAGTSFGTNTACGFKSMKDFVSTATKLAAEKAGRAQATECRSCGGAVKPSSVEYHAFHSGLEHDVVVTWTPKTSFFGKPSVELLKWDPFGGMLPLGDLSPQQEATLVHDAAFREAWAAFETGDNEHAVGLVEQLAGTYPADALLLRLIPVMLGRGYARLGMAIADAYRKRHPEDPEGHYWFGEVLLVSMNHRIEPSERVPDARSAFERTLQLRPNHLPAALSLCNLLRAEGRFDDAKGAFLRLLHEHPDCGEAHFNLAVMTIDSDPATALTHFQQGERLTPNDPDYPVGCARALLALGRKADATEALKRARNLTKEHPRFAEVEAGILHSIADAGSIEEKKRIHVEVSVNGSPMVDFNPGHEPKTAHLFYDLPRGSGGLRWLVDERILPPQGSASDLNVGDVIEVRVRSDGPTTLPARGHSGDKIKGSGHYRSPGVRFEVTVNSAVVATIGNPDSGGLSVDLAVMDRDEKVQISLHATGSDDTGFRHWAFPLLCAGDHAAVRILGPGPADEPGHFEPKKR